MKEWVPQKDHVESYCDLCKCKIYHCKTCGNNTCNGGYGMVDGEICPDCPDAYERTKIDLWSKK